MVRTDSHQLRPAAGDTPEAGAIKVVARAHKTLIWDRTRAVQRLRHQLHEYFPAALEAFEDPDAPDVAAHAATARSLIAVITTLNAQVKILEEQVRDHFGRHPDAETYKSQPGLAAILDARVLGEFGDDPRWYVSAKGRKNYGGTSPITRASGKKSAALGLLTRTLTERERSQGARHAQTMATRAQLATALLEAGRVKRVVSACKRVLADRQGVLGSDHPDLIAGQGQPGRCLPGLGKDAAGSRAGRPGGRGVRTGPGRRSRGYAGPARAAGKPVLLRGPGRRRGGAAPGCARPLRAGPAPRRPAREVA
jgi:hypothetical protein